MDSYVKTGFKRKKTDKLWSLGACIVGILINITGAYIMHTFDLPLYFDSIGTVLIAALGGYLPGIIVGLATSLISGIFSSVAIYYGVINIVIAICVSLFANKGWIRKPLMVIVLILSLCILGCGHGTFLTWFLDGMVEDFSSYFTVEYFRSVYLYDVIDKAITVLITVAVFNLIPVSLKKKIKLFGWRQTPLSDEAKNAVRKSRTRGVSMRTKIILVLSLATISISIAATVISLVLYRNNSIKYHERLATGIAKMAASVIDADKVDQYIEEGESVEGYTETENLLYSLKNNAPNVEFVYVYKILEDGCHVVFDLDTEDLQGADPGELIEFDPSFADYIPALLKGETIDPIISNDSFGWLLTAYEPVYDRNGVCRCYAACDVSMSLVRTDEYSFAAKQISLFIGFFILILALGMYLAEYDIIVPVNSMAIVASEFAYNSDEARDQNIERIRNLNIFTGDEIENLYNAFRSTTEESMRYVTDIKNKTETISQMQNGLILVLADMVESRDQCTGDHIRKTAAYTKIIMDGLRKKGYYSDQLTDEFISDVINSAPLHDIGKIHVSDVILNKPGRLTDEEFEIMKYHTTAGSEIISKAIDIVPESGYLNEAKNLAEYHHEKWNGQGYPNGLSGEDIPLSARIMAVADVFDALVSRRSYKEPFTFEKAMDIIREGSGNHFDPKIVEAFVDSEDEVRAVELSFEEE